MRRWWLILCMALWPLAAGAFDLPGLSNDSQGYREALERRFPAGATPQARAAAEARLAAAERRPDAAALATALEERAAMGDATPAQWLALARAQLRRTPPEAQRALHAAWQAFMLVPGGEPEIPSLLVIAEALARMDRPAQQIAALQAVVERAPGNAQYAEALSAAVPSVGLAMSRL